MFEIKELTVWLKNLRKSLKYDEYEMANFLGIDHILYVSIEEGYNLKLIIDNLPNIKKKISSELKGRRESGKRKQHNLIFRISKLLNLGWSVEKISVQLSVSKVEVNQIMEDNNLYLKKKLVV